MPGSTVLFAIVALIGIAVAAIVAIAIGVDDSTLLIAQITGLVVPVVGVLVLLLRVEQVHKVVNSAATEQRRVNTAQADEITSLRVLLEADGGNGSTVPQSTAKPARKRKPRTT